MNFSTVNQFSYIVIDEMMKILSMYFSYRV